MRTINSRFSQVAGVLVMAMTSGLAMAQTQLQSKGQSSDMASMDHAHTSHQDMPAHSMPYTDMMHQQVEQKPQYADKQKPQSCQDQSVQQLQKPQCKNASTHSIAKEKMHVQH